MLQILAIAYAQANLLSESYLVFVASKRNH